MQYYFLLFSAVLFLGCGAGSPRFTSEERTSPSENREERIREIRNTEPIEKESTAHKEKETNRGSSNEAILESTIGVASYYSNKFHGRRTANGETYDMHGLTAAHINYPFGTEVLVTNLSNNKSVKIRINDRKPFDDGRVIDLSLGAAQELDMVKAGITKVKLDILKWGDK